MAAPNPPAHMRITFSGTMGTSTPKPEIFSHGLSAKFPLDPLEDGPTIAEMTPVAAALGAAWDVLRPIIGPSASLTRVRLSDIRASGKTYKNTDGSYNHVDFPYVRQGSATGIVFPFQVALAVSVRSAVEGKTGRGRFFLPAPVCNLQSTDGAMQTSEQDSILTVVKNHLTAVQTALDGLGAGYDLCIASGGSLVQGLPPANHTITEVGIGRVLDTMTSRRNRLDEATVYQTL